MFSKKNKAGQFLKAMWKKFDYILCSSDIIEIRKSCANINHLATSLNSAKLEDTSVTQNDFQR